MDNRITQTLVMDMLTAAYWKKPAPGLMHHSDRGSQYCSSAYRALQASFGIQTSMIIVETITDGRFLWHHQNGKLASLSF